MEDRSRAVHSNRDATSVPGTPAYDVQVPTNDSPLSALPSGTARALAFIAILLAGVAGGLIGYALVDVQCSGDCGLQLGLGVLIGSVIFAGGAAVVAILGLRAVGEWRQIGDGR